MQISAWTLASWPAVEWYIPKQRARWPRFGHGDTTVSSDGASRLARGTALWLAQVNRQSVGLAWDWVEVGRGVVAMADPNGIYSNLRLLRDEDHFESELSSCLSLARLVHSLPWQETVVCALGVQRRQPTRASPPTRSVRFDERMGSKAGGVQMKFA
jgi:hypothetical protein